MGNSTFEIDSADARFGTTARSDGSFDCTDALLERVRYLEDRGRPGTVVIPPSVDGFRITGPVVLKGGSLVNIVGEGINSKLVYGTPSLPRPGGTAMLIGNTATFSWQPRIEGFSLVTHTIGQAQANAATETGVGMEFINATGLLVRDIRIEGFDTGLYIHDRTRGMHFDTMRVLGCKTYGVRIVGGTGLTDPGEWLVDNRYENILVAGYFQVHHFEACWLLEGNSLGDQWLYRCFGLQGAKCFWMKPLPQFDFVDGDFNTTTGTITETAHGLINNMAVVLTTDGVLPSAFSLATTYYVVSATANTFKLSLTKGGTPITGGTAAGGGTHTATAPAGYRHNVSMVSFATDHPASYPTPQATDRTVLVEDASSFRLREGFYGYGGIELVDCVDSSITNGRMGGNQSLAENHTGIKLTRCNRCSVVNNEVFSFHRGIHLLDAQRNRVQGNTLSQPWHDAAANVYQGEGILLEVDAGSCKNNLVHGNAVLGNGQRKWETGIKETGGADYNRVAHNMVLDDIQDRIGTPAAHSEYLDNYEAPS